MFESIVEKIAESQAGLSNKGASSADPQDVVRFEEVLFETSARDFNVLQEPVSIDQQFRSETGPWDYLTDKVTHRLESIQNQDRAHFKEMSTILQKGLNNQKYSHEELLLLQMRMMDTHVQIQVASKISEQVSRGVQTLYRQQG